MQIFAYQIATRNVPQSLINKNQNTLHRIENIAKIYQEMEIFRRGYFLTNQITSLQKMDKAKTDLVLAVEQFSIDEINTDHLELKTVVLENVIFMNKLIELYQNQGQKAALNELASENGSSIIEKFRIAIVNLENTEQVHLAQNFKDDLRLHEHLSHLIILGTLLSIIAVSVIFFMLNLNFNKNKLIKTQEHNQKQLLQSILNCMSDGVLVRDMKGQFILQNPAAKILIGDSLEKLQIFKEDKVTELAEPELPINLAVQGASLDNTVYFIKSENHPNGIFVTVSVRPLINFDGKLAGGVAVFNDVTEIKEAHEQLESFNYSVSHDLSAPLRSIIGFGQILLEEISHDEKPEIRDSLHRIIDATQKMKLVIDGLMGLSKLKRTNMTKEEVNLSEIAENIAGELQKNDGNRIVNFIIPKNLMANGDPRLLRIVLTNLMANSYKFTTKKPEAIIEFGVIFNNNKETFFLRDNGAGFDMRHVNKLFGAFERLHAQEEFPGTGIGLATVDQVIKKHHGEIWAQAEVNKGAIFYFTL
jgi:PAS domain S-box-containing protein